MADKPDSFSEMRSRLDEIADLVADDSTSLDEALTLFEEAVSIGILACDMAELPSLGDEDATPSADAATSSETAQGQTGAGDVAMHASGAIGEAAQPAVGQPAADA